MAEDKKVASAEKKVTKLDKAAVKTGESLKYTLALGNTLVETALNLSKIEMSSIRLFATLGDIFAIKTNGAKVSKENDKGELIANQEEIEKLEVNIKKRKELLKTFKQKTKLIVETANLSKRSIQDEYNLYDKKISLIEDESDRLQTSEQMTIKRNKALAECDEEMWKDMQASSIDYYIALKAQEDQSVDLFAGNAAAIRSHTSGLYKGLLDVEATKKKYDEISKSMKAYIVSLKEQGENTEQLYKNGIASLSTTHEKRKILTAELDLYKKKHNEFSIAEEKRVENATTQIQKAGQNLRLGQLKAYTEKFGALMAQTSKMSGVATGAISGGFSGISGLLGAEVTKMNAQVAGVTKEIAARAGKIQSQAKEKSALEDQIRSLEVYEEMKGGMAERDAEGAESAIQKQKEQAMAKIEILNGAMVDEKNLKDASEKKKAELEAKKTKAEKKQRRLKKIADKTDLVQKIVKATGDVATGVASALAYGPFIGPILAGLVGAAGAIQIGIMTKQLAKFEDGGLLNGKRHAQGGMRIQGSNIEVEGGEYVVNRESTSKNLGLVRYINSQRKQLAPSDMEAYFNRTAQGYEPPFSQAFEAGGELPVIQNNVGAENEMLVDAIRSIHITPTVAVRDILDVQSDMSKVDTWAGL